MTNVAMYLTMLLLGSNFSSTTVAKAEPQKIEAQTQSQPQSTSSVDSVAYMAEVQEEQRFVDLVNSERTAKGLKPLQVDPLLIEIARGHSKEMCDKNYFDHISPTPGLRTPLDRFLAEVRHRPRWALVGENLFYCSIVDVNRGHTCFMDSNTHRANIMNPRYDRIGVGIYKNAKGEFWVTETFVSSVD